MKTLKTQHIIISTHFLLYGAAQALVDYLNQKKINKLLYIALPLITQRQVFSVLYENGKQINEKIIDRGNSIPVIDYVIDVVQTIWLVLLDKQGTYDMFIGVDGLNCLAGLFLKKVGKVKKVIFYSIDFVPIRFTNKLLNVVYHKIEIFCVKHADESWNVSPRIAEGREKFLHISQKAFPQKVVPIGIWNNNIKKRPFAKIKKQQVLFMGHLLEKQGVQMVLDSIPLIVKKVPEFHFVIVGGGEYETELKQQAHNLQIEHYITFTGWIKNREQIDDMMSESAIALATYKPEKEQLYNFTYYADPTKLKDYLGAGLPIVLTDISYNAKEIAEKKCGILVQYDKISIANAIILLLTSEDILKQYRKNAEIYAGEFDWGKIFEKVLA